MGWPSYLEDIKKRAEDLEKLCHGISVGQLPVTDGYRAKVLDSAKAVWRQIGELEQVLRHLPPESQRILSENLYLRKEDERIEKENAQLRDDLKRAYLKIEQMKGERDEERKKLKFITTLYREGGITKLLKYLSRISH